MTTIAVFGSSISQPGSPEWIEAEALGRAIAERGWAVATGGYGGTMEAVSAGAAHRGGHVIGVTAPAVFPERSGANRHVAAEIVETTISRRIARLVESSDAVIALPGSIGTLAELVMAWNASFVAQFSGSRARAVVAVGPVWRAILDEIDTRLRTGGGIVRVAATAAEAIDVVEASIAPSKDPNI